MNLYLTNKLCLPRVKETLGPHRPVHKGFQHPPPRPSKETETLLSVSKRCPDSSRGSWRRPGQTFLPSARPVPAKAQRGPRAFAPCKSAPARRANASCLGRQAGAGLAPAAHGPMLSSFPGRCAHSGPRQARQETRQHLRRTADRQARPRTTAPAPRAPRPAGSWKARFRPGSRGLVLGPPCSRHLTLGAPAARLRAGVCSASPGKAVSEKGCGVLRGPAGSGGP